MHFTMFIGHAHYYISFSVFEGSITTLSLIYIYIEYYIYIYSIYMYIIYTFYVYYIYNNISRYIYLMNWSISIQYICMYESLSLDVFSLSCKFECSVFTYYFE